MEGGVEYLLKSFSKIILSQKVFVNSLKYLYIYLCVILIYRCTFYVCFYKDVFVSSDHTQPLIIYY
jgi:hypothetical protein